MSVCVRHEAASHTAPALAMGANWPKKHLKNNNLF
jgi:hypothetical protein